MARHTLSIGPKTNPKNDQTAHRSDMARALRALLDWAEMMGGWDAPCWEQARRVLDGATRKKNPDKKPATRG
jgi:hypothetical protein